MSRPASNTHLAPPQVELFKVATSHPSIHSSIHPTNQPPPSPPPPPQSHSPQPTTKLLPRRQATEATVIQLHSTTVAASPRRRSFFRRHQRPNDERRRRRRRRPSSFLPSLVRSFVTTFKSSTFSTVTVITAFTHCTSDRYYRYHAMWDLRTRPSRPHELLQV